MLAASLVRNVFRKRELEDVLQELGVKKGGSKAELQVRLLSMLGSRPPFHPQVEGAVLRAGARMGSASGGAGGAAQGTHGGAPPPLAAGGALASAAGAGAAAGPAAAAAGPAAPVKTVRAKSRHLQAGTDSTASPRSPPGIQPFHPQTPLDQAVRECVALADPCAVPVSSLPVSSRHSAPTPPPTGRAPVLPGPHAAHRRPQRDATGAGLGWPSRHPHAGTFRAPSPRARSRLSAD